MEVKLDSPQIKIFCLVEGKQHGVIKHNMSVAFSDRNSQ
jgi:hypothetical protein